MLNTISTVLYSSNVLWSKKFKFQNHFCHYNSYLCDKKLNVKFYLNTLNKAKQSVYACIMLHDKFIK